MYQIILIDDESIALEALEKSIPWGELGVEHLHLAKSMHEAQRIFRSAMIDIMICDIEMPNGTGIEMLRWVRSNYPNCVCIFLTCHPNFNYAKEAISQGLFEYLLKPVSAQDLEQVMVRAILQVKNNAALNRASNELIELAEISAPDIGEPSESKEKTQQIILAVKRIIKASLSHSITREAIADQVFLNPDYLSRLFKRETGLSISDYISRKRIAAAGELLASTELSVSKIASSVGYSYLAHFSKMFKKETGYTPHEYRKKYKQTI